MIARNSTILDDRLNDVNYGSTTALRIETISRDCYDIFYGSKTRLSNWDAHLYEEIENAIRRMSRLPEGEEFFLDAEVSRRALSVLYFLKDQEMTKPPKILNHDGESLSFTWMFGDMKRYLTVSDDEVDLMYLFPRLDVPRKEEVLSQGKEIPYEEIAKRLAIHLKSSTVEISG